MIIYNDNRVDLLPAQQAFLEYSRLMRLGIVNTKHLLWRAGARGGKTWGASYAAFEDAMSITGGGDYLVIAPTWSKCKEVVKPAFMHWAAPYCIKVTDRFAYLKNGVRVCFLGAHNPAAIDGFTAVGGWGDEIKDWKRIAFRKFCERVLTTGGILLFTTTPDGFNYIYDEFEGEFTGAAGYRHTINSTTYDGHVDRAAVDALAETMDQKTYNQQILGLYTQFSGQVHYGFSRDGNVCDKVVIANMMHKNRYEPHRGIVALFMDFNLDPMAGGLCQVEVINGQPYVFIFDEIQIPDSHTQEFIDEARNRFKEHNIHERNIIVYPDPAGKAGHTNSKHSDHTIIEKHNRLKLKAKRAHPAVKDRISAVNRLILDKMGRRHIFVHPKCKHMIRYFEQHKYKLGTSVPDKDSGIEHIGDGFGYFIDYELPIEFEVDRGKKRNKLIYNP